MDLAQKLHPTCKAFSMIEVVLSVAVLTIGMISMVKVISSTLKNTLMNQKVIVATELAQEGVELVRNVRDNDLAAGNNGFTDFSNNATRHCYISYDDVILHCNGNGAGRPSTHRSLYYLQYVGGYYKHGSAAAQGFSRYIFINDSGNNQNEHVVVRSFVYWGDGAPSFDPGVNGDITQCTLTNRCVFVESFLTSWK